jgi:hypothetical protein
MSYSALVQQAASNASSELKFSSRYMRNMLFDASACSRTHPRQLNSPLN